MSRRSRRQPQTDSGEVAGAGRDDAGRAASDPGFGFPSPSPTIVSVLLLGLLAAGCGSMTGLTVHADGPPARIEAIAVESVDFRLETAQSWDRFEKLRDVLAVIEAAPGIDPIAPSEFHVIERPPSPAGYLYKSDLGPRAEELGMNPDWVGVLRVSLEDRTLNQLASLEGKGQKAQKRAYASQLVLRIELSHPGSDRRLATVERTLIEDRFEDVPEYDPRPRATALLRETLAEMLETLVDEEVIQPAAPAMPEGLRLQVAESRTSVLDYRSKGASLRQHLAALDPVMRQSILYARFRYFEPDLPLARFRELALHPPGLLVLSGDWQDVRPGDVLLCIDGRPLRTTFQWTRRWRRNAHPTTMTRWRDGQAMTVHRGSPVMNAASEPCLPGAGAEPAQ